MQLLKLSDVKILYGEILAVDKSSFEVNEGEYICLIGANGSGKSSLIKAIFGLVPINRGTINLNVDKNQIAYLPQINQADKDFPATVWEIVLSGTQKKGFRLPFYTQKDKKDATDAMEELGITDLSDRAISKLSGGQLQRTLLARALCNHPRLLVLDEPSSGLDPDVTSELYEILKSLNQKLHVTILMSSHDMHEVAMNASRVIVVHRGIVFDGDVSAWQQWNKSEVHI